MENTMNKELLAEDSMLHAGMDHEGTVSDISTKLEANGYSVQRAGCSKSGSGERQTSYLLAKHPVLGEHMHVVHTSSGLTSSSKVGFGCSGEVTEEVIKESWEDIARRRAMQIMG